MYCCLSYCIQWQFTDFGYQRNLAPGWSVRRNTAYLLTLLINKCVCLVAIIWALTGSWGIAAGAHRMWCHKSYKANKKMKAMLLVFQTMALQNSVIEWVRDHRVHHKFSDTNADPHNISRGFFFAHIGWLMCKKHPDVIKYGSKVDLSDLTSDPVLRFQHKYYPIMVPLVCFLLPMLLSVYFFGENFWTALFVNMARYMLTLHITWSINSVSHIWGSKPFEKFV